VKLLRLPSAAKSPWSWPVLPLAAVAAAGHWGGVPVAETAAAVCGAIGIGVVIGLMVAGYRGGAPQAEAAPPDTDPPKSPPAAAPPDEPSGKGAARTVTNSPRGVDLRGARLVDALLVQADLREADLRGAILTGADLSGADLTGARLGPLDDGSQSDRSA